MGLLVLVVVVVAVLLGFGRSLITLAHVERADLKFERVADTLNLQFLNPTSLFEDPAKLQWFRI